jgi:hypothetical protein
LTSRWPCGVAYRSARASSSSSQRPACVFGDESPTGVMSCCVMCNAYCQSRSRLQVGYTFCVFKPEKLWAARGVLSRMPAGRLVEIPRPSPEWRTLSCLMACGLWSEGPLKEPGCCAAAEGPLAMMCRSTAHPTPHSALPPCSKPHATRTTNLFIAHCPLPPLAYRTPKQARAPRPSGLSGERKRRTEKGERGAWAMHGQI